MASNLTPRQIINAISSTLQAAPSLVPATLRQIKVGKYTEVDLGYPFCRIYAMDIGDPLLDQITTERTWSIAVEIIQEATNKTKDTAELDMLDAVNAVMNRLQGTWQLGIGLEKLEIQGGPIRDIESQTGVIRVCTLRVNCTTLIQNPS